MATKKDPIAKHLAQLVGMTVVNIACDEEEGEPTTWALVLENATTKKQLNAWILMDPEGNGPGHLDIQKDA